MQSKDEVVQALYSEIERDDKCTEIECGKLLKEIAWVLLSPIDGNPTYVKCEQAISSGRVDMIVVANTYGEGIDRYLQAYVWELKAPQLELFKMETKDRACPTEHLYGAENQLLHYYENVKQDGMLLKRMEILSRDHVHFGGIIIGRKRNYIKHNIKNEQNTISCATQAQAVRNKYFYKKQVRLWTWDRIIEIATSITNGFQLFSTPSGTPDFRTSLASTDVIYAKPTIPEQKNDNKL